MMMVLILIPFRVNECLVKLSFINFIAEAHWLFQGPEKVPMKCGNWVVPMNATVFFFLKYLKVDPHQAYCNSKTEFIN